MRISILFTALHAAFAFKCILFASARYEDIIGNEPVGTDQSYHIPMVNDVTRNMKYEEVIAKVVTNSSIVLDLGFGSGLLTMFSLKYGAMHVYGIERNKILANIGVKNLKINSFSEDRATILPILSSTVTRTQIRSSPTVLLSETLDPWIIEEGILSSFVDLRERQIVDDSCVRIPSSGVLYAQLLESSFGLIGSETTGGFKFESMRPFRLTKKSMNCNSVAVSKYLSDETPIFSFDFQNANANSLYSSTEISFKANSDGMLHGLIFWFDVSLDDKKTINVTNKPGTSNHWDQMCTFFPFDLVVRENDTIKVPIVHTAEKYIIGDMNQHSKIVKIISVFDEYLEIYSRCDDFRFSSEIVDAVRIVEDMNYRPVGTVYGTEVTAVATHAGCTLIARFRSTNKFVSRIKVSESELQQVWNIRKSQKAQSSSNELHERDL